LEQADADVWPDWFSDIQHQGILIIPSENIIELKKLNNDEENKILNIKANNEKILILFLGQHKTKKNEISPLILDSFENNQWNVWCHFGNHISIHGDGDRTPENRWKEWHRLDTDLRNLIFSANGNKPPFPFSKGQNFPWKNEFDDLKTLVKRKTVNYPAAKELLLSAYNKFHSHQGMDSQLLTLTSFFPFFSAITIVEPTLSQIVTNPKKISRYILEMKATSGLSKLRVRLKTGQPCYRLLELQDRICVKIIALCLEIENNKTENSGNEKNLYLILVQLSNLMETFIDFYKTKSKETTIRLQTNPEFQDQQ
jgi:hypothetical protein